jgi:hypothetical protein
MNIILIPIFTLLLSFPVLGEEVLNWKQVESTAVVDVFSAVKVHMATNQFLKFKAYNKTKDNLTIAIEVDYSCKGKNYSKSLYPLKVRGLRENGWSSLMCNGAVNHTNLVIKVITEKERCKEYTMYRDSDYFQRFSKSEKRIKLLEESIELYSDVAGEANSNIIALKVIAVLDTSLYATKTTGDLIGGFLPKNAAFPTLIKNIGNLIDGTYAVIAPVEITSFESGMKNLLREINPILSIVNDSVSFRNRIQDNITAGELNADILEQASHKIDTIRRNLIKFKSIQNNMFSHINKMDGICNKI